MKVMVGISNRHVHLTKEDFKILFGDQEEIKIKDLKQPGMYATDNIVVLKGAKRNIEKVRVLGPLRDYTQVEVSRTDAFTLGINPPVRNSGDLKDACEITIVGPCGEITRNAAIIATRHIHLDKEQREKYGLVGVEKVSLRINGEKPGIIENVYLKETEKAFFEVHLDMDDANAFLLNNDDEIEIIKD